MSDLTFSEGSTRMSSKDVRVAMALLAWMLEKINYGAIVVYPPYPNIESDAAFYESADILTRKTVELTLEQFKELADAFKDHYDEWWSHTPPSYRQGVWPSSSPIVVISKCGQDIAIANPDALHAERRHWNAETDYSSIARITLAFAFHYVGYEVHHWDPVSVEDILEEHGDVYTSADPDSREQIPDLAEHPLLDGNECEIPVYGANGVRIPRRIAVTTDDPDADEDDVIVPACGLYQDLHRTHELFCGTLGPVSGRPGHDSEEDEDDPMNRDDEELPSLQYSLDYNVSFHVYPHFFSKYIGQWQASGVILPFESHLRALEPSLRARSRSARCVVPVKSQCYNTIAHHTRESARQHLAQRGAATGTAAGSWASDRHTKNTAKAMFAHTRHELPHERLARQIEHAGETCLRHEVLLTFELLNMKPRLRSGDAFYEDVVLQVVEAGAHADVVGAIKSTTVVLRPQAFPHIYLWTTYPLTALLTQTWNMHILPVLKASPAADGTIGNAHLPPEPEDVQGARQAALARPRRAGIVPLALPRYLTAPASQNGQSLTRIPQFPPPQYLELIALIERCLNFAHTGAARVLVHGLMSRTWTSLALIEHGYPMFWPGLSLVGAHRTEPDIELKQWPLDAATRTPLIASRRSQELTYGAHHFQAYWTHFRVRIVAAQAHLSRVEEAGGPSEYKLHALADMAIEAYLVDVHKFAKEQFERWNDPFIAAGEDAIWARVRRTQFFQWETDKFTLGWGGPDGKNYARLTRMVAATEADVPHGLPPASPPTASIEDLAALFYKMGSSKTRKGVHAPLWPQGDCYYVLNT
ncbi:hypothetical protein BV20DRAFT_1058536, partial [Pilatotrama ljubarskyi]